MAVNNEVYGTWTLDVSIPTEESKEEMALLKENYKLSGLGVRKVRMIIEDHDGKQHEMNVHNHSGEFNRFFG